MLTFDVNPCGCWFYCRAGANGCSWFSADPVQVSEASSSNSAAPTLLEQNQPEGSRAIAPSSKREISLVTGQQVPGPEFETLAVKLTPLPLPANAQAAGSAGGLSVEVPSDTWSADAPDSFTSGACSGGPLSGGPFTGGSFAAASPFGPLGSSPRSMNCSGKKAASYIKGNLEAYIDALRSYHQ